MPAQTLTERARVLYREYRSDYHFAGFNQTAFQQRVRRLARKINPETDWDAFMYLTYIATRADLRLTFARRGAVSAP